MRLRGSPSWTRTNDPPGLRCPASACGNVSPCPLPTAAPSIAPFFSRCERSRSQQFTAMRLLSRVCAAVLIRALKQKEKGTVLRFLFWLPKLDSNQRPARVAVPGICLRQCIALPSADRCPFDRSLFLALRAVALSAVHSDAAVKQGLRCRSYQGAETKRKRNRFTVPFFWLPKLDSNQRPCG